jgi:glycosyltransferase involved in cell wall biosynthesis
MANPPLVTAVMPVFNAERFVRQAIRSTLDQSFTDFEFLIIDDGCADRSVSVIKSFNDPRIKLVQNEHNEGVSRSFNKGIVLSSGRYIARVDADDINLPERFSKQVRFLECHGDIGILGTNVIPMDEHGNDAMRRPWVVPTKPEVIKWALLFYISVNNPTVMVRRNVYERFGGCRPDFVAAEDYEFWLRCRRDVGIANLPDTCVRYRIHSTNLTVTQKNAGNRCADLALRNTLEAYLGRDLSLAMVRAWRGEYRSVAPEFAGQLAALMEELYHKVLPELESRVEINAFTDVLVYRMFLLALGCVWKDPILSLRLVKQVFSLNPSRSLFALLENLPRLGGILTHKGRSLLSRLSVANYSRRN